MRCSLAEIRSIVSTDLLSTDTTTGLVTVYTIIIDKGNNIIILYCIINNNISTATQ